jgi:hypothetical protein
MNSHYEPGVVRARTYRDILVGYLANEEAESFSPYGAPCRSDTTYLLSRRLMRLKTVSHIGKESNQLEDVRAGLAS